MNRCKRRRKQHQQGTLGGWLIIVLILLGVSSIELLLRTSLLWHGVTTQGVITDVGTFSCGDQGTLPGEAFSVRFTDRTGQVHTSTFQSCDWGSPNDYAAPSNTSPGSSITIVYLPDDPTTIAPSNGLNTTIQFHLFFVVSFSLIALVLLPLWIRKQSRNHQK